MKITVKQFADITAKLKALKWTDAVAHPNVVVKVRGRSAVWVYHTSSGGVGIGWGGDLSRLKQRWEYGNNTVSLGEDRFGAWKYYLGKPQPLSKPDFLILQQFIEVCQVVGLPPAECPLTRKE